MLELSHSKYSNMSQGPDLYPLLASEQCMGSFKYHLIRLVGSGEEQDTEVWS
jgi:hypothetical protein